MNKPMVIVGFCMAAFGVFYVPFSHFAVYDLDLEAVASIILIAGALFFEKDEDFIDEDEKETDESATPSD